MPQDGTVGHLQSFCWSISPTSQKNGKTRLHFEGRKTSGYDVGIIWNYHNIAV